MFHGFPGLLADPASPLEVLLFVAAVAATTAGVAALLYVAVLSALWASSGRRVVGFWASVLPRSLDRSGSTSPTPFCGR